MSELELSDFINVSEKPIECKKHTAFYTKKKPCKWCALEKKGIKHKHITENMHVHEAWYDEARKMTAKKLPAFIQHLLTDYDHDYGTICHAVAAAAIAGAQAINHDSKQGGITGFQSGAIMWEFITHWNESYKGKPARIINYEELLFPQYEHTFTTLDNETWKWAVQEAKKRLEIDQKEKEEARRRHKKQYGMSQSVRDHMQSIADEKVPFGLQVEE